MLAVRTGVIAGPRLATTVNGVPGMLVGRWPDFVASPVEHTQQSAILAQAFPTTTRQKWPTFEPNFDFNSNFAAVVLPLVKFERPFEPTFTILLVK